MKIADRIRLAKNYPKLSVLAQRLNAMGANLDAERIKTNSEGAINLFLEAIVSKLEDIERRLPK